MNKNIFYHICCFLELADIKNMPLTCKKWNIFYNANLPQLYYEKCGNFNYAFNFAPAAVVDYLLKNHPYQISNALTWRTHFVRKSKINKQKLKTAFISNNIDFIKMYSSLIKKYPLLSAKYINRYSSEVVANQLVEEFNITAQYDFYENLAKSKVNILNALEADFPHHVLIRRGLITKFKSLAVVPTDNKKKIKCAMAALKHGSLKLARKLILHHGILNKVVPKLFKRNRIDLVDHLLQNFEVTEAISKILINYGNRYLNRKYAVCIESYGLMSDF